MGLGALWRRVVLRAVRFVALRAVFLPFFAFPFAFRFRATLSPPLHLDDDSQPLPSGANFSRPRPGSCNACDFLFTQAIASYNFRSRLCERSQQQAHTTVHRIEHGLA